jgi:hypothetical protein
MKYALKQFNQKNRTEYVMMDNITKAINHWELQVSKVTNETRQMMLGFLNLVTSTVQDGQSSGMDQVLAKGNGFQDGYLWDSRIRRI